MSCVDGGARVAPANVKSLDRDRFWSKARIMSVHGRKSRLIRETMLKATMARDRRYDGRFYVGVTTTRIYCLPSCKAKKPLAKNIIFFKDRAEAIGSGFRGCKRCGSETYPDVNPPWLKVVLDFLRNERAARIDQNELARRAGVDISTIRRHFKAVFGTTPLAFHRKMRLAYAKRLIEGGADYLTATYECGFESASGFREAYVREYGVSPGRRQAGARQGLHRGAGRNRPHKPPAGGGQGHVRGN